MKRMILVLAGAMASFAQESPPAPAIGLVERVAASMKDKATVSFETELRTKMQELSFSQKTKVTFKRPNLARVEISGMGQDALIVLDGSHLWHLVKARNRYVRSKQGGTTKIEQYGVGLAGALFFEGGVDALKPYLASATVARDTLDGRECAVVAWNVGAEQVKLWIDGARLLQYRATRSVGGNSVEQTVVYGEMDFDGTADATAFTFAPPEGAEPFPPSGEGRLLKPGAGLPDVEAMDLAGKPLRLAAFKGKPLAVTFWFYG